MTYVFPTGPAQYASLVICVAAISIGLTSIFPVRWGWKALPLFAMALSAVAFLLLIAAIAFAQATFRDHGYNVIFTPRTVLLVVAIAGAAFGLTLSFRRRSS